MLDKIAIFTKGGIVLWSKAFATLQGSPIDELIQTVLLEQRKGAEKTYTTGDYKVEWTFHNDLELVFVAVYHRVLQLLYVEELLELLKKRFVALFGEALRSHAFDFANPLQAFDEPADKLRAQCEAKVREAKQARAGPRTFEQTKKGQEILKDRDSTPDKKRRKKPSRKDKGSSEQGTEEDNGYESDDTAAADGVGTAEDGNSGGNDVADGGGEAADDVQGQKAQSSNKEDSPASGDNSAQQMDDATIQANRLKLKMRGGRGRGAPGPMRKVRGGKQTSAPAEANDTKKKGKVARKWDDQPEPAILDYSGEKPDEEATDKYGDANEPINADDWEQFFSKAGKTKAPVEDDEDEEVEQLPTKSGWSIGSVFSGLTNRVLKREELLPVLTKFRENLIAKNVASPIADELCESVCTSLEGKTMSSFSRIRSAVKATLEETLTRILTPKSRLEILQEIARVRSKEGRPYVITFVGVNGVGKSTNLSKVCNYLLQNKLKVLIAACDTFRSGAVEQLRVHSRNLNVPLFERGYEKDPANVAKYAIIEAKQKGTDVVLVDTAGRMQNNRPLMQALANLVYTNNPDLVLFVGEALVGNEAVEQLKGFNQALSDYVPSNVAKPRQIDGIILTKFDTIDDKVGAAISMVYTTGQPIVFVGTGQKYADIKRMNVATVIRALLD